MSLNIYLNFNGTCAEAFDFYRSVFGGDFGARLTFADAPPDMPVDPKHRDKIMHVSLPVGDSELMGSDVAEGFGPPVTFGDNFAVSYTAESRAQADEVFAALKDGGAEAMAMQETFWGSYFGMCKDKFGVNWMVSFPLTEKAG
ncbi:VOC family protein [Amphiplicatus metriothermophilus]|uniref:PhnB protein n=1 Tax=Amphiplicatus metriothermophilus TaxID=1519374 RepID=A0A239PPK1_9PROT|nr:VOC family protein [Amphiplicatus metriothermophilus]MBB5518611.1 PhnB protein [Amphiplicatus metriothermophilus]SNT72231.1 PhnB protein [Amphiplicatus metriothermophilus]